MARPGHTYSPKMNAANAAHPAGQTSTGTGDVKTFTVPVDANSVLITVETTDARMTFDGQAPGVGAAPGIIVKAGQQPYLHLILDPGGTIKFASNAAGNSVVSLCFGT